jgi:RNA polymerase sigma factor (sigma-70 family)
VALTQLNTVIRHLRRVVNREGTGELTDALLLERFARTRDEASFELLLWRHGPMVLATCARLLARSEDVEDAFQATFLTLARRADTIHKRESVGSWLYKVAYRVALEARAAEVRRVERAKQSARLPFAESGSDPACSAACGELWRVVDEEVSRLPEKYRAPVVLCYLEGKTHEEAARELGWPKGTVSTRLTRARTLLQPRLARRGFALATGGLVARWGGTAATAAVPADLIRSTMRATFGIPVGGTISAKVAMLVEVAAKTMSTTKRAVVAFLFVASVLAASGGGLAYRAWAECRAEIIRPLALPPPANGSDGPQAKKEGPFRLTDRHGDLLPFGASARLGTVRLRHGDTVSSVAYAPDGKTIATGGGDEIVRLWEAATGKPIGIF